MIGKVLENGYNFIVGSISIKIHINKIKSYKISNKFTIRAHGWP